MLKKILEYQKLKQKKMKKDKILSQIPSQILSLLKAIIEAQLFLNIIQSIMIKQIIPILNINKFEIK